MKPLALIGIAARWCVRRALCFYYPRIEIEGREPVPKTGAVLFVANHPNSLMDPALIGYTVGRPVHFFAKAPLFDVPVFGALMSALGMVPAYRGQDDKAQVRKNLETLDVGAKYLQKGEAVGIFPEGKTHDREGVEQVRSGAARIASAAVAGGAAFVIVPLGLNYERKERFRSSIWVRIGEPIDAGKLFREHPDEERKAMRLLTEEIDSRLKQVVIHLEEDRWQPMLDELDVLLPASGEDKPDSIAALRQRKRLADAINYFLASDRTRAEQMTAAIEQHRSQLAAHGLTINSAAVRLSGSALAWKLTKETLWLLPGLLPFLAGTLHHLVPFLVTRLIVHFIKYPGRVTTAQNRLMIGIPIYAIWYALVWVFITHHHPVWFAWLWAVLMPFAGIEALHYAWRVRHAGRAWWSELKMLTCRGELQRLRARQGGLRGQLQELRTEYLQVPVGTKSQSSA